MLNPANLIPELLDLAFLPVVSKIGWESPHNANVILFVDPDPLNFEHDWASGIVYADGTVDILGDGNSIEEWQTADEVAVEVVTDWTVSYDARSDRIISKWKQGIEPDADEWGPGVPSEPMSGATT